MAKLALINREKKRRGTVKKYSAKRAELIALTQNTRLSDEERYNARMLQKREQIQTNLRDVPIPQIPRSRRHAPR